MPLKLSQNQSQKTQKGFTLIEVSIAILLMGILLAGSLTIASALIEIDKREQVDIQLLEVSKAMKMYLVMNKYLPCPDITGDGRENRHSNGVHCSNDFGSLPFLNLGVASKDAWGNNFAYKVNERVDVVTRDYITDICEPASVFAKTGVKTTTTDFAYCPETATYFCNDACHSACGVNCDFSKDPRKVTPPYFHFSTQPIGAEAFDSLRKDRADPKKNLILFSSVDLNDDEAKDVVANSIVAMVVSYGKNGARAWENCSATSGLTPIEIENCDGNRVFQKSLKGEEFNFFSWVTLNDAKQIMIQHKGFSK